jgi:two-component system chemotaxis response regulator CheB
LKPNKLILLGASTGGPGEISTLVGELPKLVNTSFIIAQHMPESFLQNFTKSLALQSHNSVILVEDGMSLDAENIYILPHSFALMQSNGTLSFQTQTKNIHYNPDINLLMHSAASLVKDIQIIVVILTGIGEDGVQGAHILADNGARVLTEDGINTIVDGMPSKTRRDIASAEASSLQSIIEKLKAFCV